MRHLFTAALATFALAAQAAPPRPEYTLRISAETPRVVQVSADFVMEKNAISLADWGAEHIQEGWGRFVTDVAATGRDGRPLVLDGGPQAWKIRADAGEAVRLTYRVLLEHDRHAWPHGLDEAAYVKPDAIFATGMALFIAPDDAAGATVSVDLPAGWRASTPWRRIGPRRFEVATGDELLSNAIMLGTHEETVVQLDGMQVTIAAGGAMKRSAAALAAVMRPSVAAYTRLFGRVPKPQYLVTLHEGATDGGAFAGSYSMLASEELTTEHLIDWGHIVAHETFHLWNGTGMAPKPRMDWFTEGFTDYYTLLTMRRLRLIDDALFTKKLESHVRRALGPHTVSLAEAGRDKKANWNWIYGGGAMLALVMDADIRANGSGRSLDTAMRALYGEFATTPYSLADLARVTGAAGGIDARHLFARHVTGTEPLPLKRAFAQLGYALVTNLQGEAFLVPMASAAAAARREAWLAPG